MQATKQFLEIRFGSDWNFGEKSKKFQSQIIPEHIAVRVRLLKDDHGERRL